MSLLRPTTRVSSFWWKPVCPSFPHVTLAWRTMASGRNPYHVLGLPLAAPFAEVQRTFLKLAMEHHPDTSPTATTARFVQIRQAYERIRDSTLTLDKKANVPPPQHPHSSLQETYYYYTSQRGNGSEQEFLNYFFEQTGVRLTSEQRRELVHLYRTRQRGGSYAGHGWELARRLVKEQDTYLRNMVRGHGPSPPGSSHTRSANDTSSSYQDSSQSDTQLRRRRKR